jgi:hypothetical protein
MNRDLFLTVFRLGNPGLHLLRTFWLYHPMMEMKVQGRERENRRERKGEGVIMKEGVLS